MYERSGNSESCVEVQSMTNTAEVMDVVVTTLDSLAICFGMEREETKI